MRLLCSIMIPTFSEDDHDVDKQKARRSMCNTYVMCKV